MLGQHACGNLWKSHEVAPCRTNIGGQGKPSTVSKPMQPMGIQKGYSGYAGATCAMLGVWVKYGEMLPLVASRCQENKNFPSFQSLRSVWPVFHNSLELATGFPSHKSLNVTRHHKDGNGHLRNGRCAGPV